MSHRAPKRRDVVSSSAAPRRMRAGRGVFSHLARKRLLKSAYQKGLWAFCSRLEARGSRQTWRAATLLALFFMMTGTGGTIGWATEERPTANQSGSFRYDPEGRRDPFLPLVRNGQPLVPLAGRSTSGASTLPILHGVLWDPGGASIALIDDKEAKVGDTVGDYQVVAIRQDAVVLSNGGEPVVLQISFETPPEFSSGTTTGGEGR